MKQRSLKVSDIKSFLKQNSLSPESLSEKMPISNMTIRRLLKKSDSSPVPEKYWVHFERLMAEGAVNGNKYSFDGLNIMSPESVSIHMIELAKEQNSTKELSQKLKEKINSSQFDKSFLQNIKELREFALQKENIKVSLIAVGALLYFINPIDLIPDQIFPLGYVDDLGVITMALTKIRSIKNS